MALRNIVKQGDPALTKVCKEVKVVDDHVREILDDLTETMHAAEGVGLAAPQVGILRRLAVVEFEGKHYDLINPVFISKEGEQDGPEACLSVPGLAGYVKRPNVITVKSLDREGKEVEYNVMGFMARAFCHEMDHLDGIVFTDVAYEVYEPELETEEEE